MEARVLKIEDKLRKSDLDHSRLSDFRYRAESTVDARTILERPEITLYCLDDEHRQAVFVETPAGLDLSQKPFYFLAQYQNAQRLFTTTYDDLLELANVMGQRFKKVIPMYTVGRCGGTLMSRSFNRLDTVLSLDEPDVYNNIVLMRPDDGSRDLELTRLLQASTRLLFKPFKPKADTLFIKFRPTPIEIGDLMYKAFPESKAMFVYRNAETWARSAAKSVESLLGARGKEGEDDSQANFFSALSLLDLSKTVEDPRKSSVPKKPNPVKRSAADQAEFARRVEWIKRSAPLMPPYIRKAVKEQLTPGDMLKLSSLVIARYIPGLRDRCRTPNEFLEPYIRSIPPIKLLTLLWLSTMHKYLALHSQGVPLLAVRYETLVAAPEASLRAIFEYCGLPADQTVIAQGAFAEDSQKGAALSRERLGQTKIAGLSEEHLAQLREVLGEHPPVVTADFIVPNSLEVGTKSAEKE